MLDGDLLLSVRLLHVGLQEVTVVLDGVMSDRKERNVLQELVDVILKCAIVMYNSWKWTNFCITFHSYSFLVSKKVESRDSSFVGGFSY